MAVNTRCSACGRRFSGVTGFDAHRAGRYAKPGRPHTRRCRSDAEMAAKGYTVDAKGVWRSERVSTYRPGDKAA